MDTQNTTQTAQYVQSLKRENALLKRKVELMEAQITAALEVVEAAVADDSYTHAQRNGVDKVLKAILTRALALGGMVRLSVVVDETTQNAGGEVPF